MLGKGFSTDIKLNKGCYSCNESTVKVKLNHLKTKQEFMQT